MGTEEESYCCLTRGTFELDGQPQYRDFASGCRMTGPGACRLCKEGRMDLPGHPPKGTPDSKAENEDKSAELIAQARHDTGS